MCYRDENQPLALSEPGYAGSKTTSASSSTGCGRKFLKLMIVELSHEEA